jgi:hypothetical protein
MLLETQKMSDETLELHMLAAMAGNRVLRMDNPIVNTKLAAMHETIAGFLKDVKE